MAKFLNAEGEEVEAFTADEVNAKITEATTAKEAELTAAKEALAKASDKDANFTALKEKVDKLEGEKRTFETQVQENDRIQREATTAEILRQMVGTNKELQDKVLAEVKGFAGDAKTKEEIAARVLKAYKIVAPEEAPSTLDTFWAGSGGRGFAPAAAAGQPAVKETAEQAEFRNKLGVSDEDLTKYGNKK